MHFATSRMREREMCIWGGRSPLHCKKGIDFPGAHKVGERVEERQTARERERDRQRETQRDRWREADRGRQRETDTERERERES